MGIVTQTTTLYIVDFHYSTQYSTQYSAQYILHEIYHNIVNNIVYNIYCAAMYSIIVNVTEW